MAKKKKSSPQKRGGPRKGGPSAPLSRVQGLVKARVEKLWAAFEKSGSLDDYLAYDDALRSARAQGIRLDGARR